MPSWFAAVTNKQISQLIKQTVPEIHEKVMKFGVEVLTGTALSFLLEVIDKTGKKVFCL